MALAWGAKSLTRIDDQSPIVGTKRARCRAQTRTAAVARRRVGTALLDHWELGAGYPTAVCSAIVFVVAVCGGGWYCLHHGKLNRRGGDDAARGLADHLRGGDVGVL